VHESGDRHGGVRIAADILEEETGRGQRHQGDECDDTWVRFMSA
jgi:hypothetical protein